MTEPNTQQEGLKMSNPETNTCYFLYLVRTKSTDIFGMSLSAVVTAHDADAAMEIVLTHKVAAPIFHSHLRKLPKDIKANIIGIPAPDLPHNSLISF